MVINCDWILFPVLQPGAITRLNYHVSGHVCACPDHNAPKVVWLVPIAVVLDERRLSSMAAHPSALGEWYLIEPVEDTLFDEEFPE
jgi:hypothetical protein